MLINKPDYMLFRLPVYVADSRIVNNGFQEYKPDYT